MITAEEASKRSEEIFLSKSIDDRVKEEIDHLNYWIDVAIRNGRTDSHWFISNDTTDEVVQKVAQSFKSRGFEVTIDGSVIKVMTILW